MNDMSDMSDMSDAYATDEPNEPDPQQPAQAQPPEQPRKGKAGVIVAVVALAAIIAVGILAYNALAAGNKPGAATAGSSASAQAQQENGQASASASSSASAAATSAPMLADYDAEVSTRDGAPMRLSEIAGGKPLVVNFWATWCPYCIQEMDDFQAIYHDYGDRVAFAFIDCADGQRETVEKAAAWLEEKGYDLPAYYDTQAQAQYMYGISGLPTTVVIAASGEILAATPGAIDAELMRATLDSLL